MFEIFLMVILLPASLVLNIILLRRGLRFVKLNEELDEVVDILQNEREETLNKLETLLEQMREYDMNGAFEADDEVGGAYKEIINLIETYKNEI
jgi:biopolymer transport protein ExbB/TolQ